MSTGATLDLNTNQKYSGIPFMQGEEEIELLRRVCLGDAEAKLQLVKAYLSLVVELAAGYASKTGIPFSQMVKAGTMAVIKAADDFHCSQEIEFNDHMILYVTRAMEEISHV